MAPKHKVGLATASKETRARVSKLGGKAKKTKPQGFAAISKKRRTAIARMGGKARHASR